MFGRVPDAHCFVIAAIRSTSAGVAVKIYDPLLLWIGSICEGLYSKMMTAFPMATMYVLQPLFYQPG